MNEKQMKTKIFTGLAIMSLMGCMTAVWAQDPQLSQFYAAPLYLGPSFAGSTGMPRMGLNIRSQWTKLPASFLTSSVFADTYIEKYKLGAGLTIMHDDAARLISSTYISTLYSYRISMNQHWQFVPGIQAQYFTRKINSTELIFTDQIVNGEILPTSIERYDDSRYNHFDFGVSGLVFSNKHWFGVTGNHLMRFNQHLPNDQNYMPFLLSVYGGMTFDLLSRAHITKTQKNISVTFNYKTQEKLHQLDLGLYHTNAPFMLGIWYRGIPLISKTQSKDAITLLAGYQAGPLSFAYSYDITMSRMISSTGGSHEISIGYKFEKTHHKHKKIRAVPCPQF